MASNIKELMKYRELLLTITWRDIRIKYKQSIMGVLWAFFMPSIIVLAGIGVKYAMAHFSGEVLKGVDIAEVTVKSLPWSFFVAAIRFSSVSLLGNSNLVTKIYFPKEIFPLSATLCQLFDFVIASGAVLLMFLFFQLGTISIHLLWVPLLLALLIFFTVGLGLFLAAANLFFRDVKYIVEVILTFGIFFTPVFYEASEFEKWENVLLLNPVAPVLEGLRSCVVFGSMPDLYWLSYTALVSLVVFFFSYFLFKKLEPAFAESI